MQCTLGTFMPGTDNDPNPASTFGDSLNQLRANAIAAGNLLFGGTFALTGPQLAKVEGDVFELMEAGAIWNAFAAWNQHMDGSRWSSRAFTVPPGTVPTPSRKAAAVKLPRGYDSTRLFKPDVRSRIQAHEAALQLRGMELGLSSPDIVGIRIPDPMPPAFAPFLQPLPNLGDTARQLLEGIHQNLEGALEGRSFLFAIAVKRTTRSDRLYQPLFEANILKYLIEEVLRGAAFRFHVHMGSFEDADVARHYNAASLVSLLRGGEPVKAVTSTLLAERPRDVAQAILNDLPLFPL
jgi:Cfr10I/Bse634I restriction endonuclease